MPLTFRRKGIINRLIDKLPVELHLPPSYQFCGPGTRLEHRLALGQRGINKLDEACREHDIAYSQSEEDSVRSEADKKLGEEAWKRVRASNSSVGEKLAALTVSAAMKIKRKIGGVLKRNKMRRRRRKVKRKKRKVGARVKVPTMAQLKKNMKRAKRAISALPSRSSTYAKTMAALRALGKRDRKKKAPYPRVIPVPKRGGILPFLLAAVPALAALGSVAGGAASLVKSINDGRKVSQELMEAKRLNKVLVDKVSIGKGLYLKPWKKGLGLQVEKN